MAVTPEKFVALSAKLLDDKFAAFKRPFNMLKDIGYDPITDTETKFSETIGAIPIDLKTAENVFTAVTGEDVFVVFRNVAPVPGDFDASYHCTYDGTSYSIIEVQKDAADAAIFARIRV